MSKALKGHSLAAWLLASMLIIGGCGPVQPEGRSNKYPLLIDVIDAGVYGPRTDPRASIQWITTSEQIQNIAAGLDGRRWPKTTLFLADIDPDRCGMLLIEMGQKPTGGYSVSLNQASSYLSGETAVIYLNWNTPDTDAILAQVMTSPYLLLKLPKGNFKKVVVLDQENRRLFEHSLQQAAGNVRP